MMIATSALVPPTSNDSTFLAPASAAMRAAPITPEAVPDSSIWIGADLPSSARMTPPFDLVIIGSGVTPASFSACLQGRQIARHARLYIAGDRRRHRPLVLPDRRPDVRGERHRHLRRMFPDQLGDRALIGRIGIGVQQRHHDRLGTFGAGGCHRLGDTCRVDRTLDPAVGQRALGQAIGALTRRQWVGPAREQIVGVRHLQARDFQHVLEAQPW